MTLDPEYNDVMEKVILRRSSRVLAGHLWIFSNELRGSPKPFEPGSLVEVYDGSDRFLGIGYINPHSLIAVRLLTRDREPVDESFLRKRIRSAIEFRKKHLGGADSYRAVYSEADYLPGLIVDIYAGVAVVQFLTLGMDRMRDDVIAAIDDVMRPKAIVLRNDSRSRLLEGLTLDKQVVKGSCEPLPIVREGGLSLEIDPLKGQKTGFFLDQRENRIAFSRYAESGEALDLFSYSGAWGLQLAVRGMMTTCVDESASALLQAERNAAVNGLSELVRLVREDVFDFLKRETSSGRTYSAVILDPPAFVKSGGRLREALRSYRELNAMAMRVVKQGGILATSSCSHHIDRAAFIEVLRSAARDAERSARIVEFRSQGPDHPVLLSVPETEYLKCAFVAL